MISTTEQRPEMIGLLARFRSADALLSAARELTEREVPGVEAFSPVPIHGLDAALGRRASHLPKMVLVVAMLAGCAALAMQWWMTSVDYPYLISGKPFFSLPDHIPITFEVMILGGAATAFFGMLAIAGLPRLYNPLFRQPVFRRVSNDGFVIYIDLNESSTGPGMLRPLLNRLGAEEIVPVAENASESEGLPRAVYMVLALLVLAMPIPPLLIARARGAKSEEPPLMSFADMDFQPKHQGQDVSAVFADGRAARPAIPGVISRGQLENEDPFYTGILGDEDELENTQQSQAQRAQPQQSQVSGAEGRVGIDLLDSPDAMMIPPGAVAALQAAQAGDSDAVEAESNSAGTSASPNAPGAATQPAEPYSAPADSAPPAIAEPNWLTEFPLDVTDELMRRGRQRFNIYCASCHGRTGAGNGPVSVRALQLEQGSWVPPTSIHADYVRQQPVGKLFHSITNGVRKMPAYGSQITPEDRWAIVLYVRALQRARNATAEDVPAAQRNNLRDLQ